MVDSSQDISLKLHLGLRGLELGDLEGFTNGVHVGVQGLG